MMRSDVWKDDGDAAGDVGRLAPEGMCWWSGGGVGLCKEVGQEGVGRLAPERNELSC